MQNKKNLLINVVLILVFGSVVFISSCDDTLTGIDNVEIPDANISYYTYIQPIFNAKCNFSACHDDNTMAGNLSLTSWSHATADILVVFPGFPDDSKLVWAIEGQNGASAMPPNGYGGLTSEQIRAIRTWIEEGANASSDD